MLFALGFVSLFLSGGLSGIFLARREFAGSGTGDALVTGHFHLVMGVAATFAFVLLRATGWYGNLAPDLMFGFQVSPGPWQHSPSLTLTLISFLNVAKYPPSLQYLLMTLGPALVVLALLHRARGPVADVFVTFGRVPWASIGAGSGMSCGIGGVPSFAPSGGARVLGRRGGGVKVLRAYEESLGLSSDALQHSRAVLREYGNNGTSFTRRPRQVRADGSAPIGPIGRSDSDTSFRVRMTGLSPVLQANMRLEVEVKLRLPNAQFVPRLRFINGR
jgi:hypothetical protein